MAAKTVGTVEEVQPGEGMCANINGLEIAVFNVEGEFYAISNQCPHKGAQLCEAGSLKYNAEECDPPTRGAVKDGENPRVYCPWHWWEWDLEEGDNPMSNMRVRTFDVTIKEGEIQVEI